MNALNRNTLVALGLATSPIAAAPWLIHGTPSPAVPHDSAVYGYLLVVAVLVAAQLFAPPARIARIERVVLGLLLASMPSVYLGDWRLFGGSRAWLGVELAGQAIFGALAIAGMWRAPWLIAAGIAAHGLLWDAWHYHSGSATPDWYAIGCALVDLGLAGYYALRLRYPLTASG